MSPRRGAAIPVATLDTGPWKGVYDTADPFDAGPDRLRDLLNGWIPDAAAGSSVYARAGFALGNNGNQIDAAATDCAVHAHTALDGSITIFVCANNKLYRVDGLRTSGGGTTTATDVTPVGVTINSAGVASHGMASVNGLLVVNDGANRPWVGTNLTSTPITGTSIDYDGAASPWTAIGKPTVYLGAVFFVLNAVNGVSRREDISWSQPGDPTTGWQQTNFDYNWTLTLHNTGPLYALSATNLALYYFRANSIGMIAGTDITTLASSATNDAISAEIGTKNHRSVAQFASSIFFADAQGRAQQFIPGQPIRGLWRQMRSQVDTLETVYSTSTGPTIVGAIDAGYNVYLMADLTRNPDTLYVFDAETGTYLGRWSINDTGTGGITIATVANVADHWFRADGVIVCGEATRGDGKASYIWFLRNQRWPFTDVAGTRTWLDGSEDADTLIQPLVQVETDRLGESDAVVYALDRATCVTGNAAPCSITVVTPTTSGTAIGSPTPSTSLDGTYRVIAGMDGVQGRGPSVTVAPAFTKANASTLGQWSMSRVSLTVRPSKAGPEEP